MEIIGEKAENKNTRYGCGMIIDGKRFFGYVTSNKREFKIEDGRDVVYVSKYICASIFQKMFSYGFYNVTNKSGDIVFQLNKFGPLKTLTKLKMPEGFEFRMPRDNSFSIASLNLNIAVDSTMFKTKFTNEKYLDLAICLSYFCWLRQQIWDNSV